MGRDREDRDHYDRPSWKELDRRKDGHSYSAEKGSGGKKEPRLEKVKQEYLKSVDGIFGVSRQYNAALADLKDNLRKPGFDDLARKFLLNYGPPSDFDSLMILLETGDPDVLGKTLVRMSEIVVGENDRRKELYRSKIRLLKLMASDHRIEAVLAKY